VTTLQFAHIAKRTPVNVDLKVGQGKLVEEGDKVTIQYRVCDPNKKELANSMKRGMPYTLIFGGRNSDPLVAVTLAGMHVGGSRYTVLPAESLPEGIGSIVPANTDLTVWVHVIAAKALKAGKVESPNAERAQGAVEVPRAVAHDGPTRD
jgi:FKBP-type peptidyl-prolyl cis-trans isomerase